LLEGYGHRPYLVAGDDPAQVHQDLAAALDDAVTEIGRIQQAARSGENSQRPRWPLIVLTTPKGWTGPKEVDGLPTEGTWRSHQVPLANLADNPEHLRQLEDWLRSYRPEELFDEAGALIPELVALPPKGSARMSANPHTNGG
ncbi:phosphoketolase, partial [Achromobacter xylosoxidans]|nr:phosphoketolase [Achromobacter xylosoxidans]